MRPAPRRHGSRLELAWLLVCLAAAAVLLALLAGCGSADPFTGVYWEPSTGRRFEIEKHGDVYVLYYGRDRRQFTATRSGDRLTIADAMGGKAVVRLANVEGELELVSSGRTTVLKPLPQHQ